MYQAIDLGEVAWGLAVFGGTLLAVGGNFDDLSYTDPIDKILNDWFIIPVCLVNSFESLI